MVVLELRFFAEEGADWCIWTDEDDPGQLEKTLTIPDQLRSEMRSWIIEFNDRVQEGISGQWSSAENRNFDRRGFELSQRLQQALGPSYHVRYIFRNPSVRASFSSPPERAADDPVPATTPSVRQLVELIRAVSVLALPADAQRLWLSTRGARHNCDTLALDIYESAPLLGDFSALGWITASAVDSISQLFVMLNDMSGNDNSAIWTIDALHSAPAWGHIRDEARNALTYL